MGISTDKILSRSPYLIGNGKRRSTIAFGALIAFLMIVNVAIMFHELGSVSSTKQTVVVIYSMAGLIGIALLSLSRRWPTFTVAIVLVFTVIERSSQYQTVYPIPLLIGIFAFSVLKPPKKIIVMAAVVTVAYFIDSVALGIGHYLVRGALAALSIVVPVSSFGLWIGTNQAYVKELRDRSAQLERERELLAAQAVNDERVRIARDLHDVVAHHVSLMIVQAGAIRESLPPASPLRDSLDQLADTGRGAMSEMRRMLNVLRNDRENSILPLSPAPGIHEIEALVSRANDAGYAINYRIKGQAIDLSETLGTTVFRVVQESLTNIVKYGIGVSGFVEIEYRGKELAITIENYGPFRHHLGGDGHGIAGMKERVNLFNGSLDAGYASDEIFRVEAQIPLSKKGEQVD
ncbi:sensor histidine kinase [Acidithrix ferrooxidans]|uniref:histidine kinase n=1 Tax=Acidithrix ferrooxidans TaxID=1280514 RepID=A0A0D8HC95_9ACTN|nr:histidine kinase [Acidithrix ferrooxidans]KJF15509.1 sensor histidine kinase DesK [Acidithrix ferrooxidans]